MAGKKVFEYRGVEGLVIAPIISDDNETDGGYKTGTVVPLCPVAEIGKEVESSSEAHYYDNQAMIIIQSEGPDTISITGAGMPLETIALISGKHYDKTTGAMIDGPIETRYFALGYKTKATDGTYRYVWRYKGTFAIPADAHKTEDNGTEANGTTLTYTGIYTVHKFTKGKYDGTKWDAAPGKGIVVDEGLGLADVSKFFDTVTTVDDLKAKTA